MTMPKRLMQLRLPDRVEACTEMSARYGKWEHRLEYADRTAPAWCLLYSFLCTWVIGKITHMLGIPFDWKVITAICIVTLGGFFLIMWGVGKGRSYCRRKSHEWTLLGISTIEKITLERERKRSDA